MRFLTITFFLLISISMNAQWVRQSPLPFPAFNAQQISFASPMRGYIVGNPLDGVFDPPGRVFETNDGGSSWHERVMTSVNETMNTVFFYDQNIGWMAGNMGFKTIDGGQTWNVMAGLPAGSFYSLKFITPNFGWGVSNGGLQISNDGGDTWAYHGLNNGNLNAADFISPETGLAWGQGLLKKTTNGGGSWSTVNSSNVKSAIFLNANSALAVTDNEILHSGNGGETWTSIYSGVWPSFATPKFMALSPTNIIAYNVQGFTMFSNDGGQTWTETSLPTSDGIYSSLVLDDLTGLLFTPKGNILRTQDGGASWSQPFSGPITPIWTAAKRNSTEIWAAGNYGMMLKSTDNGLSWSYFSSGLAQEFRDIKFFDQQKGLAVGSFGYVLRTTNGGQNWIPSRPGFMQGDDLRAVHILNDQFATAAGDETLIKTTDGGLSWQTMTVPAFMTFSDIEFISPMEGWTTIEFDDGGIFHTTDGGQTWETQFYTSGFPFYAIEMMDAQNGWAAGPSDAIFKTTNGGQTWDQIWLNTPAQGAIYDMEFWDAQTGWIVGGWGYIAKTTDGGLTWTQQTFAEAGFLNDVKDIELVNINEAYAVTRLGQVLHTTNGGITWVSETPAEPVSKSWEGLAVNNAGVWISGYEIFHNGALTTSLPLEIISFRGTCDGSEILLEWTTTQEVNFDRFELQMAYDGINFQKIGEIQGNGEPGQNKYRFNYPSASGETQYFRLSMIDIDGSFLHSAIISQSCQSPLGNESMEIWPNPVSDGQLNIKLEAINPADVTYKFFNAQGKLLFEQFTHITSGTNHLQVNGLNLPAGLYFFSVNTQNQTLTKKLVFQ